MTEISSRETVAIDEAAHEIYKQLTDGNNMLEAPFKTMKDMFMWTTCLGVKLGIRRPLTTKRLTIFRWAQFGPQIGYSIAHGAFPGSGTPPRCERDRDIVPDYCLWGAEQHNDSSYNIMLGIN